MLILRQNIYAEKDNVDKGLQAGVTIGGLGSLYHLVHGDKLKRNFNKSKAELESAVGSKANLDKIGKKFLSRKRRKALEDELAKTNDKIEIASANATKQANKIRRNRKIGLAVAGTTVGLALAKKIRKAVKKRQQNNNDNTEQQ